MLELCNVDEASIKKYLEIFIVILIFSTLDQLYYVSANLSVWSEFGLLEAKTTRLKMTQEDVIFLKKIFNCPVTNLNKFWFQRNFL